MRLTLSIFLFVSCSGADKPSQPDGDADSDADTDGDGDADTDTDTDTDTDSDSDTDTAPPTVDGLWNGVCTPDFSTSGVFDIFAGVDFSLSLTESGGIITGPGTLVVHAFRAAEPGDSGDTSDTGTPAYTVDSILEVSAIGNWDGSEMVLVFTGYYNGYTTYYDTQPTSSTSDLPVELIAEIDGDALTGRFTIYSHIDEEPVILPFACTGNRG